MNKYEFYILYFRAAEENKQWEICSVGIQLLSIKEKYQLESQSKGSEAEQYLGFLFVMKTIKKKFSFSIGMYQQKRPSHTCLENPRFSLNETNKYFFKWILTEIY